MKLLKYEGYKLTFEPEILTLKPFKVLYQRDRTKDKTKLVQELAFIYFFCDVRSDYQYLTDEDERMEAIKEGEGLPEDWEPDKQLLEAIKFYDSFKTTAALLLEDTRAAVTKLRMILRNIDLEERDDKGKPVYTLNVITSTIKLVPGLIKDLDEAERSISKEILTSAKMRGGQEKTIFEDGLNFN